MAMKITNKLGLPQALVNMAKQEYECEQNEYRVTSLLKGTRETILERRYQDKIEQDVSDMVWLLFGTAVHSVLEHHEIGENEVKEHRIKVPVGNYILSGQFDLYNAETKTITDYKTCSVWKIIYGDLQDWRRQLLIYAYMLKANGNEANTGEVVALMKDHSKSQAKRKADYPQLPVKKITFEFDEQDFADIEKWLDAKFTEIAKAELLPDGDLPLCTPEERFNSGDKFAVMKNGRKRAMRVLDSHEEAMEWKENNGGDLIEVRPGDDKKCEDYCSVCEFCNYYREQVKQKTA
jgi:hypothetical protein